MQLCIKSLIKKSLLASLDLQIKNSQCEESIHAQRQTADKGCPGLWLECNHPVLLSLSSSLFHYCHHQHHDFAPLPFKYYCILFLRILTVLTPKIKCRLMGLNSQKKKSTLIYSTSQINMSGSVLPNLFYNQSSI